MSHLLFDLARNVGTGVGLAGGVKPRLPYLVGLFSSTEVFYWASQPSASAASCANSRTQRAPHTTSTPFSCCVAWYA